MSALNVNAKAMEELIEVCVNCESPFTKGKSGFNRRPLTASCVRGRSFSVAAGIKDIVDVEPLANKNGFICNKCYNLVCMFEKKKLDLGLISLKGIVIAYTIGSISLYMRLPFDSNNISSHF